VFACQYILNSSNRLEDVSKQHRIFDLFELSYEYSFRIMLESKRFNLGIKHADSRDSYAAQVLFNSNIPRFILLYLIGSYYKSLNLLK